MTVVNLNKARKARAKAARRVRADANALKHGRTLEERRAEKAEAEKARRDLEGHRRDE